MLHALALSTHNDLLHAPPPRRILSPMLRFLLATLINTAITWFFLAWSGRQAEGQIDKMLDAVFNTPGVEPPIPPAVLAGGVGLLLVQFVLNRLLGLRAAASLLSILLGGGLGAAVYTRTKLGHVP